jgi:hypothetical protein
MGAGIARNRGKDVVVGPLSRDIELMLPRRRALVGCVCYASIAVVVSKPEPFTLRLPAQQDGAFHLGSLRRNRPDVISSCVCRILGILINNYLADLSREMVSAQYNEGADADRPTTQDERLGTLLSNPPQ